MDGQRSQIKNDERVGMMTRTGLGDSSVFNRKTLQARQKGNVRMIARFDSQEGALSSYTRSKRR